MSANAGRPLPYRPEPLRNPRAAPASALQYAYPYCNLRAPLMNLWKWANRRPSPGSGPFENFKAPAFLRETELADG
jgi:hypothetical protein